MTSNDAPDPTAATAGGDRVACAQSGAGHQGAVSECRATPMDDAAAARRLMKLQGVLELRIRDREHFWRCTPTEEVLPKYDDAVGRAVDDLDELRDIVAAMCPAEQEKYPAAGVLLVPTARLYVASTVELVAFATRFGVVYELNWGTCVGLVISVSDALQKAIDRLKGRMPSLREFSDIIDDAWGSDDEANEAQQRWFGAGYDVAVEVARSFPERHATAKDALSRASRTASGGDYRRVADWIRVHRPELRYELRRARDFLEGFQEGWISIREEA